jgi:hypothetical protein
MGQRLTFSIGYFLQSHRMANSAASHMMSTLIRPTPLRP